jgi:hypothetical protein
MLIMLRSIRETQKLFKIESVEGGRINIKTSEHLLSLPQNKQIEVLTGHLLNLRQDLARYENPAVNDSENPVDKVNKTQLHLLIQIIEGLLKQV